VIVVNQVFGVIEAEVSSRGEVNPLRIIKRYAQSPNSQPSLSQLTGIAEFFGAQVLGPRSKRMQTEVLRGRRTPFVEPTRSAV
jgi:hypothetical protein